MRSKLGQLSNSLQSQAELCKLLELKPSPTWAIDSKETTPEYIREDYVDETAHWKSLCKLNRQRLLDSGTTTGELEDIRCSNPNADYWRLEAEFYDAEFWRLQQLRQPQIGCQEKVKLYDKSNSSLNDHPISSRLRKRTSRNNRISKNSRTTPLGNGRKSNSRGTTINTRPRRRVESKS